MLRSKTTRRCSAPSTNDCSGAASSGTLNSKRDKTGSRTRKDLKRVEHFRSELNRTEAALDRTGLDELALENGDFWLQIYADLIDCATASLDRMRSGMSAREAADRFETATDVQMLEELVA